MDYNDDDFDEFNEFNDFDPREIERLFRERMEDEEFRNRFMGIIGSYQRDFDRVMKMLYGNGMNPYAGPNLGLDGLNPGTTGSPMNSMFIDPTEFQKKIEDLYKGNLGTEGDWNSEHWVSPDGKTSISSFSNTNFPEDRRRTKRKLTDEEMIGKLEHKLQYYINIENYEKAATTRDLINELKNPDSEGNSEKNEETT